MAALLTSDPVSDWIDRQCDQPFGWDVSDCTSSVDDYVFGLTGLRPAEGLRGTYKTARGARRIWKREGGYLPMIRARMERCGFAATTTPVHGDVGVVIATSRFQDVLPAIGPVAAVRLDRTWVIRAGLGVIVQDFETVAAWSMAPWIHS